MLGVPLGEHFVVHGACPADHVLGVEELRGPATCLPAEGGALGVVLDQPTEGGHDGLLVAAGTVMPCR
jgi:hypothetical protein